MLWVVAKDDEREMDGGEWEGDIQKRECGIIIPATSTSISVRQLAHSSKETHSDGQ